MPWPTEKSWLPFCDMRLHHLDNGTWDANIGLGCRYSLPHSLYLIGCNLYADLRKTKHSIFQQIGLGVEALSPYLKLRCNAYFSEGTNRHLSTCLFDDYEGNYLFSVTQFEHPLNNIEGGVEVSLLQTKEIQLHAAANLYCLFRHACTPSQALGTQGRITLSFPPYLFAEGSISYDRLFHTIVQGKIGFQVPLNSRALKSGLQALVTLPVRRQEIIPVEKYYRWWTNF